MTCEEVGIYIRLLDHAWDQVPIGTLDPDEKRLQRMAGATDEEWKRSSKAVLAKFDTEMFYGRLTSLRMRAVYDEMQERREKQKKRGKAGADARWKGQHPSAVEPDEE